MEVDVEVEMGVFDFTKFTGYCQHCKKKIEGALLCFALDGSSKGRGRDMAFTESLYSRF